MAAALAGDGLAGAAEVRERDDRAEPLERRFGVRIAGAAVEGVASLGPDAQGVAAVTVARMIAESEALEARVEPRGPIPQGAEGRVTAAVVAPDLRSPPLMAVGHQPRELRPIAAHARSLRVCRRASATLCLAW